MSSADLNWIANYIWGIADDVLRDRTIRQRLRGDYGKDVPTYLYSRDIDAETHAIWRHRIPAGRESQGPDGHRRMPTAFQRCRYALRLGNGTSAFTHMRQRVNLR